MIPHSKEKQQVLTELKVSEDTGLSAVEAKQRLEEYGENALKEKKGKSLFVKFLEQFKDVMILILLVAAGVSFFLAYKEGDAHGFFEPFLILLIVVINAVIGVFQENKAEKSLEALKSLSAPNARVIRDGNEEIIDAGGLVPGDIIKLEAGDFVPADARLINSAGLKSEESALTGESVPSEKDAGVVAAEDSPIGDRDNMVFSGCMITYGTALAVVTATGMNTEMGKIANLLDNDEETQTPLQIKLAQLGKYMGILAIFVCIIIFIMGVNDGMPINEIFMTAVSLAVSAIPEGLPVIVTIILSIGVGRMAERHAVVKKLPAVETLGSTSVICSDKTGTLTQNKMTLTKLYDQDNDSLEDVSDSNTDGAKRLLMFGTLCNDAGVKLEDGNEVHLGDPTESAIIIAAMKNEMTKEELDKKYKRVAEIPFDSDRKLMTTVHEMDGKYMVITKGAYDVLKERCHDPNLEKTTNIVDEFSADALRILGVAYKETDTIPENPTSENLEDDLEFMGLLGMIDPPREEVKDSVEICRQAGIKPVMITGDHVLTAKAIAGELGIFNRGDKALTGAELMNMTDSDLDNEVENISVYARVSPEDKIRVVKAWQRKDKVVSMTGDGVNDAPALKAADIGCAMGITGTDVSKEASDMILMDDNFATIVEAVREGRGIYDNIKKTVGFLLGTNIGEVLLVFASMLLWGVSPLLSMQLLWINLVTDSFPAIALGMEPIEPDVMDKKPRPKKEGIFAGGLGVRTVLQGIMFGLLSLFAFRLGYAETGNVEGGRTMAFMVLALSQVIHSFNMRSHKSIFKIGIFSNPALNKAAALSFGLTLIVLLIPPVADIFGLIMMPVEYYLQGLGLAFVPVVILEIFKALKIIK